MTKHEDDIVLVTGSNGRIGDAVMRRLRQQFDNVVGLDRTAPTPPPPDCTYIPVDVTSDESMREGLRVLRSHHGSRIATVVHLAAYYDFLGKPSPKYEQITVQGTRRLLRGLQEGFEVEQFIFASTMLVHRPGVPGLRITEDSPLGPTWAYPESKVRTEEVIHADRGSISSVILRLAGVYDDVCHSPPLAHQIQRIYERQMAGHLYSGETSHGQAFVHMDDVVDAIELAVGHRTRLPKESVILIGEAQTLSYDELQHTFSRLIHGESWETHNVPAPIAKTGAWLQDLIPGQDPFIKPWMINRANDHYALDITRAHDMLDWTPKRSLSETLPKMVAALKADPIDWYREQGLEPTKSMKKQAGRTPPSTSQTAVNEDPGRAASIPNEQGTHVQTTHAPADAPPAAEPAVHRNQAHVCPMHPEVSQSSPGNCPRCGTELEVTAPEPATEYSCPMHPDGAQDNWGEGCLITGIYRDTKGRNGKEN